jgi:hypothetical protein
MRESCTALWHDGAPRDYQRAFQVVVVEFAEARTK